MRSNEFRPARTMVEVSSGESVRILRELQELSQNQLSRRSGIPQSTISAIENDRIKLGVERAKVLARALRCHPAVLVFPGWQLDRESAGEVLSELAREALTGRHSASMIAEEETFYGFDPFPHRGPAVSNALINELLDEEPE